MHIPGQIDKRKTGVTVIAALAVAHEGEFSDIQSSFSSVIWKGRVIFAEELLSTTEGRKLNRLVIQLSLTEQSLFL